MIKKSKILKYLDYGEEGLLAYELSQMESTNPYLICMLEHDEDDYRLWDNETHEPKDKVWFHKDTELLKEVKRFKTKIHLNHVTYIIYEVTHEQAYLNIWSMASHDLGIACYTVSGECDIYSITANLKSSEYFNDEDFDCSHSPWVYTQHYGGGSDEHHAVFYTTQQKHTEFIQNTLDRNHTTCFD